MDKTKLQKMMAEMAALGAKYGFQVIPAGGSMSSTDAKIKFTVKDTIVGADGKATVVVSARAKQEAAFEKIDISKTFVSNGKTHRVIDYHPRKYKAPWITEASDGKNYKWPTDQLKLMLAINSSAVAKNTDGLAHLKKSA